MAERVGIVLVHGIGEQRRFEHLESQVRELLVGFKRRPDTKVTVEILSSGVATYRAEQDTWASGKDPSARITIRHRSGTTEINVHEVWWADVNEPYSLAKQVRFWLWGLSVWLFPESLERPDLRGFGKAMVSSALRGGDARPSYLLRAQLFLAGLFFLVAAFSLGAAVFLAQRLFGLEAPKPVRVFVNYISGVKLYNQRSRRGAGIGAKQEGFLDTLDDPPRVSTRRRMVRSMVAAAGAKYDRWYILAHSLGTVVAFNGIMEYGQALANYLNKDEWDDLVARGWAGQPRSSPDDWYDPYPDKMSPTRPVWLGPWDLVYRDKLFERFKGILTYGSPLGKFAAIWPARVPVNKVEPIF